MQQVLLNLQAELERLNNACNGLLADSEEKQNAINQLFTISNNLDDIKADKQFVQNEVDIVSTFGITFPKEFSVSYQ